MKYRFILTVTVGLLYVHSALPQSKEAKQQIEWKSFDAGIDAARKSHRKILVDVYTDWCSWCKKMDREVYTDPKVRQYLNENFVVVKMNAEGTGVVHYKGESYSPAQLAAAFGVNGYPATLFLKENDEPITLLPGYMEARIFIHVLNFIAENQYETKQFDAYLKEKGVEQ